MLVHESDYLAHHGVKGMKWGIRKARERSAQRKAAKAEKKGYSEDYKATKDLRKKKVSQMSDAELRQAINRMNLEQQYKSLNSRNVSAGQKFVQEVLRDSAKEVAKEYTKKGIKTGISKATEYAPKAATAAKYLSYNPSSYRNTHLYNNVSRSAYRKYKR